MLASTCSRMAAAYLVLLVVGGAVAVVGIRQVLLVRLDSRTRTALSQEVSEVRTFVEDGRDPTTGRPFARLEQAFDVYVDRDVPCPEEAFLTFLDGELHRDRLRSFPGRLPRRPLRAGWSERGLRGHDPAGRRPPRDPGAADLGRGGDGGRGTGRGGVRLVPGRTGPGPGAGADVDAPFGLSGGPLHPVAGATPGVGTIAEVRSGPSGPGPGRRWSGFGYRPVGVPSRV